MTGAAAPARTQSMRGAPAWGGPPPRPARPRRGRRRHGWRGSAPPPHKDPRQIELVLRESREIIRRRPGIIIVEQNLGIVMANAGIDHSNIESEGEAERVLLLPVDPDETCRKIRAKVKENLKVSVGVIINDSVGRAWRVGTTGLAIGVSGLPAVVDLRGEKDIFGRELLVSEQAVADELASAASLLQGQASEKLPVVIIRGFNSKAPHQNASALIRNKDMDMFR